MKLSIEDDCGSSCVAVLKLDGSPAIKKEDFAVWSGEYHKNGKWSYTEGGIAIKDGMVLINNRSTHSRGNWTKTILFIQDNNQVSTAYLGKIKEMEERPKNCPEYAVTDAAFDAAIEKFLDLFDEKHPGRKAEIIADWDNMQQFI
jgi:hypothetical protein